MYIITDNCVGCHNCAMECPMHAIRFVGRHYEIDQERCVGCGLCEKLCHACAIDDTEAPAAAPHDVIEKKCDVLFCGGGSGLIGAVRAAQLGKKVILIEKAKKLGGNSDYAHGFFPIYTKWHEELGIEDMREQAVPFFVEASEGQLDEKIVRTCVYGCGEFFDWLCEQCEDIRDYYVIQPKPPLPPPGAPSLVFGPAGISPKERYRDNLLCRDEAIGPGWGYTIAKYKLLELVREKKLDLEILTETAAEHLILDDAGNVCGVMAKDPGGIIKIEAKAVSLNMGGFARSREKMQRFFNLYDGSVEPHCFTVRADTGDALDMLEEIGVAPDEPHMFTPDHGSPSHHPYSFALNMMLGNPNFIQLNTSGKRYRNEMSFTTQCNEFYEQDKRICWAIGSLATLNEVIEMTKQNPMVACNPAVMAHVWDDIEEEMAMPRDVAPGPVVRKADTIRELAVELGIDPDAMEAEVQKYNEFCKTGNDADFHKPPQFLKPLEEGPFYAIYGQRFIEMAAGGVRVNENCQVLREDGTVINGLYGGGDMSSALQIRGRYAHISELTWAVSSAFVCGTNAAEYASKQEV